MEQQPLFDLNPYVEDIAPEQQPNVLSIYLGEEAAEAIINKIGGWSLRIPVSTGTTESQRLIEYIGLELTEKLIQFFGGEYLYIPNEYFTKVDEKHQQIKQLVRDLMLKGKDRTRAIQKAAKEFSISERQVRRILSK